MSDLPFVDCIDFSGSTVSDFTGSRMFLSTGALKGNDIDYDSLEKVTYMSRPSRANIDVSVGDIIFAKMQNTIKVLAITEQTKDLIVSTGFFVIRPKKEYDREFIFQYLNSKEFNLRKDKYCSGATQKAINNIGLRNITIPELDITEQQRVGRSLEIVTQAIKKRQAQISILAKLANDTFVDMFSDGKFHQLSLEKACDEIYRYPTFYGFEYQSDGIPVVKIGNIKHDGKVDEVLRNYDFITQEIHDRFPKTHLKLYDSVMAVRGDGSTAKRIGIVLSENIINANISPNLLRLSANPMICAPLYLYYFLISRNGQNLLEQHVTRTAKKTITATNIKTIEMPLPSMDKQMIFQKIVLDIEDQKSRLQDSLVELQTTYKSIMQKAFNGELF